MGKLLKGKILAGIFTAASILAFSAMVYSSGLNNARIMPKGSVAVFKGDKKIAEFSREAPLPEDCLLSCSGKCGIKMDHLSFVATDGSRFSVSGREDLRVLNIEEGTVYFILSALPKTLMFKTPHGTFTTDEIMLNVSSDGGFLQGYVSVTQDNTDLGVIEGGSMLVSTIKGDEVVRPGHRIILAQATMGRVKEGVTYYDTDANTRLLYGMVPVGVTAAIIVDALRSDSDGTEGSPFTP